MLFMMSCSDLVNFGDNGREEYFDEGGEEGDG